MTTATASWQHLAAARPELADTGRQLLYQGAELGSGFLATVSAGGTPRVHPVCPILALDALWLFIVEMSPKYRDLLRNRRFALHSMPTAAGGEEFALQGRAEQVDDGALREGVRAAIGGRLGGHAFERLFRCDLTTALHTHWDGWGTAATMPRYEKWHA